MKLTNKKHFLRILNSLQAKVFRPFFLLLAMLSVSQCGNNVIGKLLDDPLATIVPSQESSAVQAIQATPVSGCNLVSGTYYCNESAQIEIIIEFSSSVTVTGTPSVVLNTGSSAEYISGSNSNSLTFQYTVGAGDNASPLNYLSTNALNTASGALQMQGNAELDLALPSGLISENIVIDTIPPELSNLSINSNNADAGRATIGNSINLSFDASEPLSTTSVSIGGLSAATSNTGNSWTASITADGSLAQGTTAFSATASDLAGNSTAATYSVTDDASAVVFDSIAPVINPVTISSNNTNPARAKASDVITLQFTSTEELLNPTATIAGESASIITVSPGVYQATLTLNATHPEGNVAFSITANDRTGNSAGSITTTSDASSVIYDRTLPTVTLSYLKGGNTTGPYNAGGVVITALFSEPLAGIPQISIDQPGTTDVTAAMVFQSGNQYTYTYNVVNANGSEYQDGLTTISMNASDAAGNLLTSVVNPTFSIDTTAPLVTSVTGNPVNGNYSAGQSVVLLVQFNENIIRTGVLQLALAEIGASAACSSAALSTLTCTLNVAASQNTADLNYLASNSLTASSGVSIRDAAGNISNLVLPAPTSASALRQTSNIAIDTTAPVLSSVEIYSNNALTQFAKTDDLVTLAFTSNEPLNNIVATIAGKSATVTSPSANSYLATVTMQNTDTQGSIAFNIAFSDLAGNPGSNVTATTNASSVTFDRTRPAITTANLASDNSYLDITFSENVYAEAGANGTFSAADFQLSFSQNAGEVSAVSIDSVVKTDNSPFSAGESATTLRLNLNLTGSSNGLETIEVNTASDSVFDAASNSADSGVTTGLLTLNAADRANILSATLAADNSYLEITFSQPAFGADDNATPLAAGNFLLNFNQNSGTATGVSLTSVTDNTGAALTGGASVVRLQLNVTGSPAGVESIEVRPANAASIFTSAGAGTPASATTGVRFLYDQKSPLIVSVQSNTPDGTYGTGSIIHVSVLYDESISVSGNPQLTLATGPTNAVAGFLSVSGGNTLNFQFTVQSDMSANPLDILNSSSLVLPGPATIHDAALNDASLVVPVGATPGSLSQNKAIIIDAARPTLLSATTLDYDNDGHIDHYRLQFSRNMQDSSFPGYIDNSQLGNSTTSWAVFNYTNIRINPTFPGDVENDAILYIQLNENVAYDTDVKPDLTTTSNPGLTDTLGNPLAQLFTPTVIEADGAAPFLISRNGTIGSDRITLGFSEAVYGNPGISPCGSGGELDSTDFQYNDLSLSGVSDFAGTPIDNCGSDRSIVLTVNANFDASDSTDSITVGTGTVFDAAGNAALSFANPVITLTSTPGIISANAVKYNQIRIQFNDVMTSGAVAGSAECSGGASCSARYQIAGITVTSAVSADSSYTATPGVASEYFILNTSSMTEGNLYTISIPAGSITRNSDSVGVGSVNNTINFFGDGRPVVSSSSDSNCTDVYIQYDQEMDSTAADNRNVTSTVNYSVTGCTGTCSGIYATLPVSPNSASWNTGTMRATVNFANMSSTDIYTVAVYNSSDLNGNSVAPATTTQVNGCNAPDTVPPRLDTASATSDTSVLLTFSEAVEQTSAENIANYAITGLTVSTAIRQTNPTQVLLTTSLQGGSSYTATVRNVDDLNGNTILDNGADNVQPFIGGGASGIPQTLDGGAIFEDPFNDGVTAGQIFVYDGKLTLGPSSTHSSVFEMTPDMGTSNTVTLDASDVTPGIQSFQNLNYTLGGSGCGSGQNRTLAGVDFFYAGCIGGTSTAKMTGSECTANSGTEFMLVGGYFDGQGGCYRDIWSTTDKGLTRAFRHTSGLSAGGVTFRSASMSIFKEQVYVAMGVEGSGEVRFSRVCLRPGGCSNGDNQFAVRDLNGARLNRLGHSGTLRNYIGSGSYMRAIDSMWEHDADGIGAEISSLYIAGGGRYNNALGSARTGHSDGGILRLTQGYSSAANAPTNCSSASDCDTKWEDLTPDNNPKFNSYMSIALPQYANSDFKQLNPSDKFTPAIRAFPYMRTAPNGDLYVARNACSVTTYQNMASGNFLPDRQTCPKGSEVPQIWMMPANCGNATACRAAFTLVAEYGTSGKTNMQGLSAANQCGSAPNRCAANSHISLLEFNGNFLYVGFDNETYGLNLWRTDMSSINSGNTPAESAFSLVSPGFGINDPTNTRIFTHTTIKDGATDFLVVISRDGGNAIKIYRTRND